MCSTFHEDLAVVVKNNKWGYVNTQGEEVIPCKYDSIDKFKEDLTVVRLNNKYGYMDKTGKKVIPLIFEGAIGFKEGLAGVCLNNKWGFINKQGEIVIPCKYDFVDRFINGLCAVSSNKGEGVINKQGEEVIPLIYYHIFSLRDNLLAKAKINGKWGYIDLNESTTFNEFINMILNIGSRKDILYYMKYKDTYIMSTGCFIGTLKEFEEAVNDEIYKEVYPNAYKDYIKVINDLKATL